ncbi:MAG: lipocalin-like domain-containing protein [Actinomycetia bacterium]|nr:lipocalin-like domain-containing protein [Actinomycetes bacterium]
MGKAIAPAPPRMLTANDLVGAWSLQRFWVTKPDGARFFPYGQDAMGTLLYTATGWMSADLCRADRGSDDIASLEYAASADPDQRLRAYDGYTSYSGRYELQPRIPDASGSTAVDVLHHIELALAPAMIGQTLRRTATLAADELALRYSVRSRSGLDTYRLTWTRA